MHFVLRDSSFNQEQSTVLHAGLSSYPRFFGQQDGVSTLDITNMELMSLGVDLRKLNREGKEVVISEFGTGGGAAGDLRTPARTASDAAMYPYYGIGGE